MIELLESREVESIMGMGVEYAICHGHQTLIFHLRTFELRTSSFELREAVQGVKIDVVIYELLNGSLQSKMVRGI
jgi:hypothetical protein